MDNKQKDKRFPYLLLLVLLFAAGGVHSATLQKVDVGIAHTIVLKSDGSIRTWGQNHRGQLGDGTNHNSDYPVIVSNITTAISVASGHTHSVALLNDGTVWNWGDNSFGQLGTGNTVNSNTPVQVAGVSNITAIVAGAYHTVALKSDGTVWTWGINTAGQLGDGSLVDKSTPVQVQNLTNVVEIATGLEHSYALKGDGTAWTWGVKMHTTVLNDDYFALTPISLSDWSLRQAKDNESIQIPGFAGTAVVASSPTHSVIIQDDNTVLTTDDVTTTQEPVSSNDAVPVLWSGAVTATLNPLDAVATGVQWRVNSGDWHDSGTVASGLADGSYSVDFLDSYKWAAPASQSVTVSEGGLASLTADFIRKKADISVNIEPADAVTDGAQWRIRGGAWNNSGAVLTNMPVDNYVIEFSSLNNWHTPVLLALPLREGGAALSGTYITKTGNLTVNILPAEVAASGAQWRIAGGAWQNSGATLENLPVGDYTIEYSAMANWDTPVVVSAAVVDAGTTLSSEYTIKRASISLQIQPSDAVVAGAQWRIAGGEWQNSGAVISNLPVSVYTIEYSALADWNAPASHGVVLTESGLSLTADYVVKTGSINMVLTPAEAVVAGAQWRVSGGAWQTSGTTLANLPVGTYTVEFNTLTDWHTPAAQSVVVTEAGVSSSAGYTIKTGGLSVQIQPAEAATAGAQWRIAGGAWQNSGSVLTDLPVGDYTIEFSTLANYAAPANITVTLTESGASTTGTYTIKQGDLTVELLPAQVVSDGAQWRIEGGEWQNSGAVLNGLDVKDYTIEFSGAGINWITPAAQSVTLTEAGAAVAVEYSLKSGALSVYLNPADAVDEGAQWRVVGDISWNNSGDIVTKPVGDYNIEFNDLTRWITPVQMPVTLGESGEIVTVDYSPRMSTISVTFDPVAAITAGAQWRIVGEGVWRNSGEVLPVQVGDYTVEFNKITGWVAPANQLITVDETGATPMVVYTEAAVEALPAVGSLTSQDMASAITLAMGDIHDATIAIEGDSQIYAFSGEQGKRYILTSEAGSQMVITLFDSAGQPLMQNSPLPLIGGQTRIAYEAVNTGTYYLQVQFMDEMTTGDYGIGVAQKSIKHDFNNDGRSDLFKRDQDTGRTSIEYLNGASIAGGGQTVWYAGDLAAWPIKGFGDFNGDGTSDVLWRSSNGKIVVWSIDNLDLSDDSGESTVKLGGDTPWQIKGTADFNGDGREDILWRHMTTGRTGVWFMNGKEVIGDAMLTTQVGMDKAWRIAGLGDFNGDGYADIIWRHGIRGDTAIWFIHGGEVSVNSGLTTMSYSTESLMQIVGVADFNGDGIDDVMWRDDYNSEIRIWMMDGTTVVSDQTTSVQLIAGSVAVIARLSDFNGDGNADILWDDNGTVSVWLMNGYDVYLSSGGAIISTPAYTDWGVVTH